MARSYFRSYLNFRSSASKLETITCKFTKSRTLSEVFFEEFHYKCRTAILKNASRWLLLGTTLFSKYSSMAASQRQLQRYIYSRNSRLHMFYISYSDVMLERDKFLWIFFKWRFQRKVSAHRISFKFYSKTIF